MFHFAVSRMLQIAFFIGLFLLPSSLSVNQPEAADGRNKMIAAEPIHYFKEWQDFWIYHLCINLLGYATILVPGYLLIKYLKKSTYIEQAGIFMCYMNCIFIYNTCLQRIYIIFYNT